MAVHNTTDLHFMKGLLHHALCGFILELECYVTAEHDTTPRPVKLDVSIIEGTVGKLKRVVQDQGSTRIRDACIRAKLCASETHLDILGVVAGPLEKLIAETVEANIESVASRKDRFGKMRLAWCRAKAEKREQKEARAALRAELVSKVQIRFDCDDTWIKKILVEQAKVRSLKHADNMSKKELIQHINDHDATLDSTTLVKELRTRGLEHRATSRTALLKCLAAHDRKQQHPESVRDAEAAAQADDDESAE